MEYQEKKGYRMSDFTVNPRYPNNLAWFEIDLSDKTIDYLWKISNKAKKRINNEWKHRLAGNITQSYRLIDENNYFWKTVLYQLTNEIYNNNGKKHVDVNPYIDNNTDILGDKSREVNHLLGDKPRLIPYLRDFWVNYQYKHEFNPKHDHSGVYSFVIWMKIPYTYEEQSNLDFQKGLKRIDKKAGMFEFYYYDILGRQVTHMYEVDKEFEGRMVFFPSKLSHQVYPFYNSDDERVSISGNVWLKNASLEEYEDYVNEHENIVKQSTKSALKELGISL